MLRRLFYDLETTPGQEKVILEAIDSMEQHKGKLRSELYRSREALANLIRSEGFDDAQVKGLFDKHDAIFEEVRASAVDSVKKIHEALNPEQRKRAADLLENPWGFRGGHCGGGRRFGGHCGASC
jgi:Spy/CpxP family protein refolding chaperone